MESRLIKDVQPKYNKELKDDKTFPYLMITTREDFPRVEVTREPQGSRRQALRSVRQRRRAARRGAGAAEDLQVPHLQPGHRRERRTLAVVSPVPAGQHQPVHRALQSADQQRGLPPGHQAAADVPGRQQGAACWSRCATRCRTRRKQLQFEKAARLRDEIHMLETLDDRGELDTHAQPEVFYIDPKKGLAGLRKVLKLTAGARGRSKASTSRIWAAARRWPAWCSSSTACRSSPAIAATRSPGRGHRRLSQHPRSRLPALPAAARRGRGLSRYPADRRRQGAVNAALAAFREQQIEPPTLLSLAKREEEIYLPGAEEPLRLSRHAFALRLLQYVRDEAHRFAQHYHSHAAQNRRSGTNSPLGIWIEESRMGSTNSPLEPVVCHLAPRPRRPSRRGSFHRPPC